jgi:hypothetical protein
VIDIAFQESKKAGHGFHRHQEYKSTHQWRLSGSQLLADVPMCLLQAILDGNLASKVFGDDPADAELCSYFEDSYWTIRGKGPFAPAHYVRIFTDDRGYPPTPEQLYTVLDGLRKYTSGSPVHDRFCADVDQEAGGNADTTLIHRGPHRLFNGSGARVQILLTFIYALQAYLDETPLTEHRRPLREPLKYVGFSLKETRQSNTHSRGGTSWLMTSFFCVCKLGFSRRDGSAMFNFHKYIVAYPIDETEVKLREEILSRACKSYHQTGLGFNIRPAETSASLTSLDSLRHGDVLEMWLSRERLRDESPVLVSQIEFDCRTQFPTWLEVLEYHNTTLQQRLDKIKTEFSLLEDCVAEIEKMKARNRRTEATYTDVRDRRMVTSMHRDMELELLLCLYE